MLLQQENIMKLLTDYKKSKHREQNKKYIK